MQTTYLTPQTTTDAPCVATIGFFDGVHRGHQFLISRVVELARQRGMASTVITFDRHPREVLQADYVPEMLTTLDGKLARLSLTGADRAVVLHFDRSIAAMSAREFMSDVLRRQLGVRVLVIGYDNRFGHNRTEGFDDYVRYGREMDMEVIHSDVLTMGSVNVSSSEVRRQLTAGDVERAAECLGYRYSLCGEVAKGFGIGHTIGFPTANIDISGCHKMIPKDGVYAVVANINDGIQGIKGMVNIGTNPTFGERKRTVEVHLFDFKGDIYGCDLTIDFYGRIRDERKFDELETLIAQLGNDRKEAERMLNNE